MVDGAEPTDGDRWSQPRVARFLTDEGALSVVGPQIAGRAKTDVAGQWVGNCLEAG
jgi:hypothetical protein